MSSLWWWYVLLVLFRIGFALWPQSGYIHPDELFQSAEIVAGDLFNLNVTRTWEFVSDSPMRSIIPIYMICGIPFLLLKFLSHIVGPDIIYGYSMVRCLRLTMVMMSFIIDFCVHRISIKMERSSSAIAGLMLTASSYVTIVFYTRTFSNSLESFLFAAILYISFMSWEKKENTFIVKPSVTHGSDLVPEKVAVNQFHQNSVKSQHIVQPSTMSLILVLGIFNRPTFVLFAFVPYIYWLLKDKVNRNPAMQAHYNMFDSSLVLYKLLSSVVFSAVFASLIVICDSIYYGHLDASITATDIAQEINAHGIGEFMSRHLVITPINFVLYNTRAENLAQHGTHPHWLHVVVNAPVLFSVLFILNVFDVIRCLTRWHDFATVFSRDIKTTILLASIIFPLIALSVFPHQEMRFLIPLLTPLAILYASRVLCNRYIYLLWIILNISGCIFFGCLHQGGVISSVISLQQRPTGILRPIEAAVFWRTYMPPRHLFIQPLVENDSNFKQRVASQFPVHDLKGCSLEDMLQFVGTLIHKDSRDVIVVFPGSLTSMVFTGLNSRQDRHLEVKVIDRLWPHLSTEDLPDISASWTFDLLSIVICEVRFRDVKHST